MSSIAAAKHRKEPEAQTSPSGKPFTRKNPDVKNYVAPLVIQPTEKGAYRYPLEYSLPA